jgi:MoaA/NifB/PqqE/SkfB family radical SAM enzyme
MNFTPRKNGYIRLFDSSISRVFRHAASMTLRNPAQSVFFFKTLVRQNHAAGLRTRWARNGVHVPPLMIVSSTRACNLKCRGCYSKSQHRADRPEMAVGRWREVLREADELGVSIVMVAGGEPFARPEFMELTGEFKRILFPVFTNGLLLSDGRIGRIRRQRNLIPVFSLEGSQRTTDIRRGDGVYHKVLAAMKKLGNAGVFFGMSFTVTRANFNELTDPSFFGPLIQSGCRLFFFVEYIPVEAGSEDLVLEEAQRRELERITEDFRTAFNAEFIVFPGDEEQYGGCLAAGRGFIHVGPDGSLEPCPFAPYSDANLNDLPLKEALRSDFLRAIRENHGSLTETRGGCALWANRKWVQSLLPGRVAPGPVPE